MTTESTQMQALQLTAHGDPSVLQLVTVPAPRPANDQILVRIRHSSINPVEWKIRKGNLPMIRLNLPAIIGNDFAGEVVEVGKDVEGYGVGDQVCGVVLPGYESGTYAEYIAVNPTKERVAKRPSKLPSEEAAAAGTSGLTAFSGLFNLGLLPRSVTPPGSRRVLILGASGGVGVFATQFAKLAGAYVVGVCSGKNEEYVKEMGADRVIDYTKQAFEKELAAEEQFDVVLDLVGGDDYYYRAKPLLKKTGRYVTAVGPISHIGAERLGVLSLAKAVTNVGLKMIFDGKYKFISSLPVKDFGEMMQFIEEAGDKFKGVVTQTYALAEGARAQEESEKGVRGKIALAMK
ncbi:uncharacterized protein VTP21DRAFT_864 [Calcarisporiella thermophila]|uniref:uncharacterized protein n=1 Tax=Calcarisporiella thermophila TaxID=911321 RepID=UPI0037449664